MYDPSVGRNLVSHVTSRCTINTLQNGVNVSISSRGINTTKKVGHKYTWYKTDGITIKHILSTRHHWDYAGGNDNCEGCTHFVYDGEVFYVSVIKNIVRDIDRRVIFTGDCLFVGGAGRFFEVTAKDMYPALFNKLAKLPIDTLVYCGHEYTSNYRFALSIDGDNADLIAANEKAVEARNKGLPTIPSTIDTELKTNPFLRVHDPKVGASLGFNPESDVTDVLAAVREAKNNFK